MPQFCTITAKRIAGVAAMGIRLGARRCEVSLAIASVLILLSLAGTVYSQAYHTLFFTYRGSQYLRSRHSVHSSDVPFQLLIPLAHSAAGLSWPQEFNLESSPCIYAPLQ